MKHIIDNTEFWTMKKDKKYTGKVAMFVFQTALLFIAGTMLAYSIVMFGTN